MKVAKQTKTINVGRKMSEGRTNGKRETEREDDYNLMSVVS